MYVSYSFKKEKDLNIEKKPGGDTVIKTNEHVVNVCFNRDIS